MTAVNLELNGLKIIEMGKSREYIIIWQKKHLNIFGRAGIAVDPWLIGIIISEKQHVRIDKSEKGGNGRSVLPYVNKKGGIINKQNLQNVGFEYTSISHVRSVTT